jgi:hydroxyacylglutathione hydrolase
MPPFYTIQAFVLGQIENNTYLLSDSKTKHAIVIDPAFGIETVIQTMRKQDLQLCAIWITHAHFDHIAGVRQLLQDFGQKIPVFLHKDDLALWEAGGGAPDFGFNFDPKARPTDFLEHGQQLRFGDQAIEVRHTPGHTPGHVIFYWAEQQSVFCGDLIFYHGVGRTDLAYSDAQALIQSIHENVFPLPEETKLLSGHGRPTTVREEKDQNPFL